MDLPAGLEPATSSFVARRSESTELRKDELDEKRRTFIRPGVGYFVFASLARGGFEPLSPLNETGFIHTALAMRDLNWSTWKDSNLRPSVSKTDTLARLSYT